MQWDDRTTEELQKIRKERQQQMAAGNAGGEILPLSKPH
jgi:hypothetical protein